LQNEESKSEPEDKEKSVFNDELWLIFINSN
jgi:hypothetical protein